LNASRTIACWTFVAFVGNTASIGDFTTKSEEAEDGFSIPL
jgi:hypothetical protein